MSKQVSMLLLAFVCLLCSAVPAVSSETDLTGVRIDEAHYFETRYKGLNVSREDTHALIKQKALNLQLALERWAVDHSLRDANPRYTGRHYPPSFYPYNLDSLLRGGYLGKRPDDVQGTGYYANPYTSTSINRWNALNVAPGDWSWSPDKSGNFTYVYVCNPDGYVEEYLLVFYGESADDGYDINRDGKPDGTVIMLRSWVNQTGELPEGYTTFWNGQPVALPWAS